MTRNYKLFLTDILESIEKILEFTKDMSFEEFVEDDKTASAVVRKLEIVGEATKNIPAQIRKKYKTVPWKEMAKTRDKLIHGYFTVDYEIVWKVVKERLPIIKPELQKVLKEIQDND